MLDTFIERENYYKTVKKEEELYEINTIHLKPFLYEIKNRREFNKLFSPKSFNKKKSTFIYIFKDDIKYIKNDVYDSLEYKFMNKGVAMNYLIYFDGKKYIFKCVEITNQQEIGSNHKLLFEDYNHRMSTYITSGKMMFDGQKWLFDTVSPFNTNRESITIAYDDDDDDKNALLNKKITDTFTNIQFFIRIFKNKNPMREFQYIDKVKLEFKFIDIFNRIKTENDLPYISFADKKYTNLISRSISVLNVFKYLKSHPPIYVMVNAYAKLLFKFNDSKVDTKIDMSKVDQFVYPQKSKWWNAKGLNRLDIIPTKTDFSNARRVLQILKTTKFRLAMDALIPKIGKIDYYDILKRSYLIEYNQTTYEVRIDQLLGSSNADVYLGTIKSKNNEEQKVVIKVNSFYDHEWNTYTYNTKLEQKHYKRDIISFILPNHSAYAHILPYLGKTITSIPLSTRKTHYKKFKEQYLAAFRKTITRSPFLGTKSYYNDIKPENTTVDDDQNFHLIDPDRKAYTEGFYGDGKNQSFTDQLIGVIMLLFWFKTDKRPFNNPEINKYKWLKEYAYNDDIKQMIDIIFDQNITSVYEKMDRIIEIK